MAQPPPPPPERPGEEASAPATYPAREITGIVAFLRDVAAAFESDPAARDEFFALVTAFGEGGRGGADAGAVVGLVARAGEILAARPVLLAQFHAYLAAGADAEAPNDGGLASTRPRRSNRSRPPAAVGPAPHAYAPSPSAGAFAVFAGVDADEAREEKLRRKREKERARRAARREEEARLAASLAFLARVQRLAGDEALARFVEAMLRARDDEGMDAGAVYDAVREALGDGPAAEELLRAFADQFLPGEAEWEAQQQEEEEARRRRAARKRKHVADDDRHVAANKPRADDDRRHNAYYVGESSAQRGRDDGKQQNLRFKIKKAKYSDGDTGHRRRHAQTSVGGECSRRSDIDDVPARHRPEKKKPRADEHCNGRRSAALRIGDGGSNCTTSVAAAAGEAARHNNTITKNNDGEDDEFRRFRRHWEFETGYSVLLSTTARADELLRRLRDAAGDDDDYDGTAPHRAAPVAELFPSRESRAFLERLYGGRWGAMRAALERGGRRSVRALALVRRSLAWVEEAAVEDARARRDPARAAQRLTRLVRDAVVEDEDERRPGGGDDAGGGDGGT